MTRWLGPIATAHGTRYAAVMERRVAAHPMGSGTFGNGALEPLAILIADGTGARAISPAGVLINAAELEELCPGAWADFTAALPA